MISRRARVAAVAAALALAALAVNAGAATRPQTPPPTPVPPHGSPSPFPTSLATPNDTTRAPTIAAAAGLLVDPSTGQILYEKEGATPRPIASLTKVMTALLTMESLPMDEVVRVDERAVFDRDDYGASSTLGLRAGERITVRDLLYGLLLSSANDAAVALAIAVDGSEAAFVKHMNARAHALRMRQTQFFSSNGLDDRGHSTPRDLVRLMQAAEQDEAFGRITATRVHRIPAPNGHVRVIQNRNALLWLYPGTDGAKTGMTARAGACVIATAQRDGRQLLAIVLDAPREAFSAAASLLNYGFDGWERETLVTAGQAEGTVEIRGGTVPVVAGESLETLVPIHNDDVSTRIIVRPDAAFPPPPRQPVGWLAVRAGDTLVGRVPLVVPDVPPAPASSGPWWARAAGAVAGATADAIRAIAA